VDFTITYDKGSTADHFHIRKPIELANALAAFLGEHLDKNIVELGIAQGGSTALMVLLGRPRHLVSIEYDAEPVRGLVEFIDRRQLGDRVRPYFGVDQADRARVARIVDDEFGDAPLDLVIDDAPHLLAQTTSSFETLFPRLRRGGQYLIEDWNWQQNTTNKFHDWLQDGGGDLDAYISAAVRNEDHPGHRDARAKFVARLTELLEGPDSAERRDAQESLDAEYSRAVLDPNHPWHEQAVRRHEAGSGAVPPLTELLEPEDPAEPVLIRLVFELVLANIARPGAIAQIVIDKWWVKVRRGPDPLDPETFRLTDLYQDHLNLLR
jgi:predicted O-methyltransferase YrrM